MVRKKIDRELETDPNPLEWIRASDTLKIFSAVVGKIPAEDFLIQSIAHGGFDLGASLVLHEADIGHDRSSIKDFLLQPTLMEYPEQSAPSCHKESRDYESIFEIDRDAFSRGAGWEIDINRTDLSCDKILALSPTRISRHKMEGNTLSIDLIEDNKLLTRRVAFNLCFRMRRVLFILSAISGYDPDESSVLSQEEQLGAEAQGSDKDHYDWGPVENELIGLIESGGMSPKFGPVWGTRIPQAISMYVKTRVTNSAGKHPSFETVRKRVRQKILPLWRERDAARK